MGSAWSQGRIVLAAHPCPLRRVADLSRICVETFLKEEPYVENRARLANASYNG